MLFQTSLVPLCEFVVKLTNNAGKVFGLGIPQAEIRKGWQNREPAADQPFSRAHPSPRWRSCASNWNLAVFQKQVVLEGRHCPRLLLKNQAFAVAVSGPFLERYGCDDGLLPFLQR